MSVVLYLWHAQTLRTYVLLYPKSSITLVMVPTALVRPSRKTSRWSMCRYSGVLMKRKCTVALSPVRRQSLSILRIVAVWRMLPQCTVNSKILTGTQTATSGQISVAQDTLNCHQLCCCMQMPLNSQYKHLTNPCLSSGTVYSISSGEATSEDNLHTTNLLSKPALPHNFYREGYRGQVQFFYSYPLNPQLKWDFDEGASQAPLVTDPIRAFYHFPNLIHKELLSLSAILLWLLLLVNLVVSELK